MSSPIISFVANYTETIKDQSEAIVNEIDFMLSLQGVEAITDADGSKREVYAMRYAAVEEEYVHEATYFLDGSLRFVRWDNTCFHYPPEPPQCEETGASWHARGTFAPYGIGLAIHVLGSAPMMSVLRAHLVAVNVTVVSQDSDQIHLRVPDPEPAGMAQHGGDYWFDRGALHPSRMEREMDGFHIERALQSFKPGLPLPAITPYELRIPEPNPNLATDLPYPGAEHDYFGFGWTVADAYRSWLASEPTAKGTLADGGCMVEVLHSWTVQEGADPLLTYDIVGTTFSYADSSGTRHRWRVAHYANDILPPQTTAHPTPADGEPFACQQLALSPDLSLSMDEVWMKRLGLSDACLETTLLRFLAFDHLHDSAEPATGWGQYQILEGSGQCAHQAASLLEGVLAMDAVSGLMLSAALPHQDMRSWDQGSE